MAIKEIKATRVSSVSLFHLLDGNQPPSRHLRISDQVSDTLVPDSVTSNARHLGRVVSMKTGLTIASRAALRSLNSGL